MISCTRTSSVILSNRETKVNRYRLVFDVKLYALIYSPQPESSGILHLSILNAVCAHEEALMKKTPCPYCGIPYDLDLLESDKCPSCGGVIEPQAAPEPPPESEPYVAPGKKHYEFQVVEGLTLAVQDVWAKVNIQTGRDGVATVDLDGDDKLLEQIHVSQPGDDEIFIRGTGENGGGITIINPGGSMISVGNIRAGRNVVIGGSVVGGTIISSGNMTVIQDAQPTTITVRVPQGTNMEAFGVSEMNSRGLGGRVDITLSGQGEASIEDAHGMKIRCSGQSHCRITKASGGLTAGCSGQSSVVIVGNLDDVEADASGQSSITVNGNCRDCIANARGQSNISVSGHASGRVRKHGGGMSRVSIE